MVIKPQTVPEPQFFLVKKKDNHLSKPLPGSPKSRVIWEHFVNPKGFRNCGRQRLPPLSAGFWSVYKGGQMGSLPLRNLVGKEEIRR